MRKLHCFSIVFILFLSLPALLRALPEAAPAGAAAPSAAADVPNAAEGRINLDVVVTNKAGQPVTGLEQKDFTLLDDKRPSPILSFHSLSGTAQQSRFPAQVILVVDEVNLGVGPVDYDLQEIEKFLRQGGGHLAQPVSIVVFEDDGLHIFAQPSMDGNALAARLQQSGGSLRSLRRSAGAWGAIDRFQFSTRMLTVLAKSEAKIPGKKLLIWVGPGWPMLDSVLIETSEKGHQQMFNSVVDLSTTLRQARISVYNVSGALPGVFNLFYQDFLKGVKTDDNVSPPNLDLKVLAVQSGGQAIVPNNDLAGQIERCVQDANAFYTLSFDPPSADKANAYHDLKVQIDQPGLTARTNTGYYNQP